MWLMTIYGFFSTAVYTPGRITVRARVRSHIENLKTRFPQLTGKIVTDRNRDYHFRLTVDQRVWAQVVQLLAAEQTWANFKNKAKSAGLTETAYLNALHYVWSELFRLQEKL